MMGRTCLVQIESRRQGSRITAISIEFRFETEAEEMQGKTGARSVGDWWTV